MNRKFLYLLFMACSFLLLQDCGDFKNNSEKLNSELSIVLAEGEIELEIEGKAHRPNVGDEIFIPANAVHTVRNIGKSNNVWYYGYRNK